jgi:hypothetical protein
MNDQSLNDQSLNDQTADSIAEFCESDPMDATEASDEGSAINRLTELGNLAVSLKLIGGHGFHQGQYELLRDGKFLLMTPIEAQQYLEKLIAET